MEARALGMSWEGTAVKEDMVRSRSALRVLLAMAVLPILAGPAASAQPITRAYVPAATFAAS